MTKTGRFMRALCGETDSPVAKAIGCEYRGCRRRGTATYVATASEVVYSFHVCPSHSAALAAASREQVAIDEIGDGRYDVRIEE